MEERTIRIDDISVDGEGIGRLDGKVVFVAGALPGEDVRIEIITDKGSYCKARLADQREPVCGGCPLIRMPYDDQLAWKQNHVLDTLKRIGGIENVPIRPIIGMEDPYNYRNKGEFKIGDKRPLCCTACTECPIQSKKALEVIGHFNAHPVKNAKELIIRTNREGDVLSFTVQRSGYPLLFEGTNLIRDHIGDLKIEVDARSFYQVNSSQCEKLYSIVKSYIDEGDDVLDLYCGAGTIGLFCADKASRVIGVEVVKEAVVQANRNAVINGIVNASFICGRAEDVIDSQLQGVNADAVIVDPPRAGCKESLLAAICRISPSKIVYVSCNPATLARDLKMLCSNGYELSELTPVDLFPHTVHVECVALLSKHS